MAEDKPLGLDKVSMSERRKKKNMSCHGCGEERAGGFEWMVVTCGCGCGEERRTCEIFYFVFHFRPNREKQRKGRKEKRTSHTGAVTI